MKFDCHVFRKTPSPLSPTVFGFLMERKQSPATYELVEALFQARLHDSLLPLFFCFRKEEATAHTT
jgi:hypothetical protein